MKNVCFFNSIKFWGGGEKLHLEYAIEFKKRNYTVFLPAHPASPLWDKANAENLKTFPITVGNLSFLNPFKLIRLVRFYKKNKIDTVIFSSSQDLKLGSISAKIAGVKNIVYLRGLAVPIKASLINRFVFKSLLSHIISNSDETKRSILKYLGKYIDENKVKTIYHGIDVSKLKKDGTHKLKEIQDRGHGIILGNAGRLTPQKGQDKLLIIAKELKAQHVDFTLFIAGTGELQSKLENLIDEYDIRKEVVLLGFVEDMEVFMNSIDIFLLTSEWEGFGYVLVEAMIKSKPVVAFNKTSNPEIVQADVSGFLVEYPNLELFAEKTKLLIDDKELRDKMGKASKLNVIERFQLVDRITELENYLLGKTKPNNV
jgi:glycosyltransferase involved in cell wall biosynthesis